MRLDPDDAHLPFSRCERQQLSDFAEHIRQRRKRAGEKTARLADAAALDNLMQSEARRVRPGGGRQKASVTWKIVPDD